MIKPLWALAGVALLGTATAAGMYAVVSSGGEEEFVQQVETATPSVVPSGTGSAVPTASATPTPASATPASDVATPTPTAMADCNQPVAEGSTRWRWENVTILVRDAEDISVVRFIGGPQDFPPDGGPAISLRRGDSVAGVDAKTGRVFFEQIDEADRPAFSQPLATIQVGCPRPTEAAPWPYGRSEPDKAKLRRGNVLYWEPDPDAGLVAQRIVPFGGDEILALENVISRRFIDVNTGKIIGTNDRIAPEDAEAFERWTQAAEAVGP